MPGGNRGGVGWVSLEEEVERKEKEIIFNPKIRSYMYVWLQLLTIHLFFKQNKKIKRVFLTFHIVRVSICCKYKSLSIIE